MAGSFRIVQSGSAALRLNAAADFVEQLPIHQPLTIVAASRGAADDFARRIAVRRGATLGVARFSLAQLAARVATTALAGRGIAPASTLGAEAVAARTTFEAVREGTLTYLKGVVDTPGFARALARTAGDLRLAAVSPPALTGAGAAGPDLAALLARMGRELDEAHIADRAQLYAAATAAIASDPSLAVPLVLLDVHIESPAEGAFVAAAIRTADRAFVTCPAHDEDACRVLQHAGGMVESIEETASSDLASVRQYLFDDSTPPRRELDGSLQVFSAPGEGREAIEIARRILAEARAGVPFDDMAVLVRSPHQYHGLLEHALSRARIPAWFDRGTRRPHPAGRAFVALIACAADGLSARRFAEYLSLAQLPAPGRVDDRWRSAADEVLAASSAEIGPPDDDEEEAWEEAPGDPSTATVVGTLRAPRRWERLLVEAAVIGGGADRWARRLDGLARELDARRLHALRDDVESPQAAALARDLRHLAHLRAFALPIVQELAGWTGPVVWGEWLARLERMAPRVLRVPVYVLRVLADMRPMATVGPVPLDEVRNVLSERLRLVDAEPPHRRYGRVFVGNPAQARGRTFSIVFVPGLAERMFPRRSVEDPLLLDSAREQIAPGRLATRSRRVRHERLLLHLAAGAATRRLYVSYPRLDVAEGRARVPSFYALDLLRGATGRIPDHEHLEAVAAQAGDPTLAWPAPRDPMSAIDDQEHDLAVLGALLATDDPDAVRGHAHYLLRLNPALRRSVTERWARGERRWSQFDGLTRVTPATADALAAQRLARRAYSPSALQKFAACPYQFLLAATYRLEPDDQPVPIQRLDPLTRGSIIHAMQALFFREALQAGVLPVRPDTLAGARTVLESVIERVAATYNEELAPAIPRVWDEEIAVIARDLRGWLTRVALEDGGWVPRWFEFAFGLREDVHRDPASQQAPVTVDGRFTLRGAIDLVEEHAATGHLRVVDHKTGKDRTRDGTMIAGGETLQPVLYSMAIEQITGRRVEEARLSFCTAAGGYRIRTVPLTDHARGLGVEALEVIDRAIEFGFLAAAPKEGACTWCAFRPVCGSSEEQRVARKPQDRLHDVHELRRRP